MPVRIIFALCVLALLATACSSVSTPSNERGTNAFAPATTPAVAGRPSAYAPARVATSLPAPSVGPATAELQYRLGPLDKLNVVVFQVPELSGDFQVGSDGNLGLPLIGSIHAVGRPAQDIQREITAKLAASYIQSPQVTVTVTEFNSQKVTVDGAVLKPGVFPVSGSATLLDYLALAGGLPRVADPSNVAIFRQVGGKQMAARFDVGAIRDGKATNPIVYGGDTIVVATSGVRAAWTDFLSAMPVASFAATAAGL